MSARHCRVCGTPIPDGAGVTAPEPPFTTPADRAERDHWLTTLPKGADGWRHTCQVCADAEKDHRDEAAAIVAVCGIEVPATDARVVFSEFRSWDFRTQSFVSSFPTAENAGKVSRKPWGHVTDADREHVRQVVQDGLAALDERRLPTVCEWGACGICGIREAVGWYQSSIRWPDGSPAPLCSACNVVHERRGEPIDAEGLRRVAVECLTSRPVPLGDSAPNEFRAYFEHRDCDMNGTAEPFGYSDRLREYAEEVWTNSPECAPQDRADEFRRRHEERLQERADQYRQERERMEATTW